MLIEHNVLPVIILIRIKMNTNRKKSNFVHVSGSNIRMCDVMIYWNKSKQNG